MEISLASSFTGTTNFPSKFFPTCINKFRGDYYKRSSNRSISCKAGRCNQKLYKLLSLESENASEEEIKKAYRAMALRYHPDVCPPSQKEDFTKMFVEVHTAYKTLSDPISRLNYDRELASERVGTSSCNGTRRSEIDRRRWRRQLSELMRRSEYQRAEETWGSRMRAKHA